MSHIVNHVKSAKMNLISYFHPTAFHSLYRKSLPLSTPNDRSTSNSSKFWKRLWVDVMPFLFFGNKAPTYLIQRCGWILSVAGVLIRIRNHCNVACGWTAVLILIPKAFHSLRSWWEAIPPTFPIFKSISNASGLVQVPPVYAGTMQKAERWS